MTKHGGHEWKARGLKCWLGSELLITLSWIPHLSFKKLKRLITVVWHELWAETSCQKNQKRLQVVECNDFLDLLQICIQSLKHGNISDPSNHSREPWFARLEQKLKTRHGKCPECYFLTWEYLRKWFICPHPQDFPSSHAKTPPSRLRPNAVRPGWEEWPLPGDGAPAPSLLAAVLEPSRRSTIMDHVSQITSLTHDIIKHSGYYGSWTINKHEKTLPIKSIWKFVSFINWPPNMRMKPSNMGIYVTIKLNFIATDIQPFNNYLSCCWLLYVQWSKHGMFFHKGEWSSRHW